jgi:2-hydroxy-3-keto-5-methylthiopentenyl-1-phosphate phosphatase
MLAFLDYDGTLTTHECNEIALERYADAGWRAIEDDIRADRVGHAVGFDRQVALIRAPRAELLGALVEAAVPSPGLHGFLDELGRRGGRAVVVSAGMREAIEAVWRREALPPVELYASELVGEGAHGGPPYHLDFNPALGDCPRCGPQMCKGTLLRELARPHETVLVFGDGASDVCPAREAGLTFARGHLAERCAAEGLEWRPLPDFTGVWQDVDAWTTRS